MSINFLKKQIIISKMESHNYNMQQHNLTSQRKQRIFPGITRLSNEPII